MDTTPHEASDGDLRKLVEMIDSIKVAMLTTVHAEGTLRRPLATRPGTMDGRGSSRCFRSPEFDDAEAHPQLNLAYADARDRNFASVSGPARAWCRTARAWGRGKTLVPARDLPRRARGEGR